MSGGSPGDGLAKGKQDAYALAAWEPDTGKKLHEFNAHKTFVRAVAFSPDGLTLASSGIDMATGRTVRLFDAKDFSALRVLEGQLKQVDARSLAFSPDSKQIAAADYSHDLFIWDVANGLLRQQIPSRKMTEAVTFSVDGKFLAHAGENGNIAVWDVAKRAPLYPLPNNHQEAIFGVSFAPNAKTIVTGSSDGTGRLWDAGTGKFLREFRVPKKIGVFPLVNDAAFSPDGTRVAFADHRLGISLWDPADGSLVRQFGGDERSNVRTVTLAFSPDGKTIASESVDDNATRLWNPETGEPIGTLKRGKIRGHCVAFSGDGKSLISAGDQLYVWNLATGELRMQLKHNAVAVAYSSNGKLLASGSQFDLKLWDAETGMELAKFPRKTHYYAYRSLAFSPDNRYLAFVDAENIRLLDTTTRKELKPLTGHRGGPTSLAFSRDGALLVSAGEDCTGLVWDMTTILEGKK